jgi:hypothetical protein
VQPLVAYFTFYRNGSKAFEAPSVGVDSRDPKTKTPRIRFTLPAGIIAAGTYDCQVTVLDPSVATRDEIETGVRGCLGAILAQLLDPAYPRQIRGA